MSRRMKLSLLALVALLLLAGAGAAGLYAWARASLPLTAGTLRTPGLSAEVSILRDRYGIVTIKAANEDDAYFALGFAHAQDRLAQMELMRRTGAGRLSEVVGEATVPLDRFMRTLGLYHLAKESLEQLDDQTLKVLHAYAAGVNAFLDMPDRALPPEFQLLGIDPEPWRPADSLVWGRLMALQLSGNWSTELLRLRLSEHLTPEQIDFLWPGYPKDAPVTLAAAGGMPTGAFTEPMDPERILPWRWAPKDASNSWVLAGSVTGSGSPVLANDPHLGITAPGPWYLARIEAPGLLLAGATAPGVPFLVLGHNGRVAWGFTTTHSDTQDLFIEKVSDEDPAQYLAPDGPRNFAQRQETILVKDAPSILFTSRATRHGPVISDARPMTAAHAGQDRVMALAWPALRADDQTAAALYGFSKAVDWPSFLQAAESFHSPQQTILYADRAGTIAMVAPGRVPIRKRGDGSVPVPGWTGDYDWTGFIPFEELPMRVDPPNGRIVTANNRLVPKSYPYLLTRDWPDPYRAERIEESLEGGFGFDVDSTMVLQNDSLSTAARELVPRLLALLPADAGLADIRRALGGWDSGMPRARPEPLIFYGWLWALNGALLGDELRQDFPDFARPDPRLIARTLSEGQAWCDIQRTEPVETCPAAVAAALSQAVAVLSDAYGSDWRAWRWGDAHRVTFRHDVWSRVPLLGSLLGRSLPTDGGDFTVNRGGVRFGAGRTPDFEDVLVPSLRAVYDLADLDNSRFMIAGGQSGHPLSPHYGDLLESWRDGLYVKLVGAETEATQRLVLLPQ